MSRESVQFVEMVRQAIVRRREPEYIRLYCLACGKFTASQVVERNEQRVCVCIFCGTVTRLETSGRKEA